MGESFTSLSAHPHPRLLPGEGGRVPVLDPEHAEVPELVPGAGAGQAVAPVPQLLPHPVMLLMVITIITTIIIIVILMGQRDVARAGHQGRVSAGGHSDKLVAGRIPLCIIPGFIYLNLNLPLAQIGKKNQSFDHSEYLSQNTAMLTKNCSVFVCLGQQKVFSRFTQQMTQGVFIMGAVSGCCLDAAWMWGWMPCWCWR